MRTPETGRKRLCPLVNGAVDLRLCAEVQGFVDGEFPFSDEMRGFTEPADYGQTCRTCEYRGENGCRRES